ncbi:hypothetical protein L6164_037737 [Bauhinia variegata]|uniref:Uncharacterized protein n=1 Tax=Bauhinia variegata TaxID=167791 RepID=A0ACB9KKX3_BAUVA|nr:hypothetical protein L6164_037737 [Bauhinia variegata]
MLMRVPAARSSFHGDGNSGATEDTPLLGPNSKPLSSQPKTFANVFIAIVGAGVLGLPYAFKRAGWMTSLLTLFLVALLTCRCMMLLVYTRRKLEYPNGLTKISSFGDLGFTVCGSLGRFVVDALVVLSQTGFCIGYLIFIGNTSCNLFLPSSASNKFFIWVCLPFQLGLNSIATLTHLAPLSIFADVVDLGAIGVVLTQDLTQLLNHSPPVEAFGDLSMFFYSLGVAVYSFEGIGMVLPLESEAKEKDKFGMILGLTMIFIFFLYAGFGTLGYLAFGEETKDVITDNFGAGFLTALIKLGLCVNLFFTFPLMMNPVYEIVERRFCGETYCLWLRWVLVLMVSLAAVLVPNFADFLSLVGSSVCCALGFVLPALFHLLVFKEEMDRATRYSDLAIVLSGVVLGVSGTWCALLEIFAVKA